MMDRFCSSRDEFGIFLFTTRFALLCDYLRVVQRRHECKAAKQVADQSRQSVSPSVRPLGDGTVPDEEERLSWKNLPQARTTPAPAWGG